MLQAVLESGGASMLTRNGESADASFASEKGKAAMQSYADMVLHDESAVHLTNLDDGLKAFNDGRGGHVHLLHRQGHQYHQFRQL